MRGCHLKSGVYTPLGGLYNIPVLVELSSTEIHFYTKNGHYVFESPFGNGFRAM